MTSPWVGGSKKPPYSVAAEKAVLGAILVEPKLMDEVRPILTDGEPFFRSQHGQIYTAMVAIDGPVTRQGLAAQLDEDGLLETIGGEPYLDELESSGVPHDAALTQAEHVREKARVRRLIDAASAILSDAYRGDSPFDEVMARAQKRLADVQD